MAEWRSQYCSTDNQYILFRIWVRETATNVIANTSTIRITVYAWRTNEYTTNYGGGCNVKIDGTARGYQYWDWGDKPVYYDSDTVLYDESNIVIPHNSDGTKTINVAATCEWYADGSICIDSAWQSFDVTLTALDRSAPTVSVSTSNIGVSSFTISASSNVNCDRWDRSIDNGSTWTNFSTTNGTSASTTVTGLSPNTTYNVKVRARKTTNQVYGTSSTTSPKTIGNSILNSVSTVTADNSTVSFTINTTVYVSSYTHKLEIKNGSTSILTKTGLTLSSGNNTITLTSAERTTLLNAMSTIKSFTGTFNLSTWSGSTQIGSTTSKTATVQTTSANSAPTFTGFTYSDTNSTTTSVTGNNQILIQGYSTLRVVASAATAKNGATIKSYSVSAGSATASSTSTTINVGTISNTGTVAVTVSAVDSRGYSISRSVNVTVLAYTKIKFTSSTIRRVNEVENTIQLSFAGTITSLSVGGTDKNALQACQYRYKKTSDANYGSYTNITSGVTRSGNNLSYSNSSLVNLDANYSWNLQIYLQDKLTTDTITLTVSQGIPLVTFRTKKVGINVRTPTRSLDVAGDGIKCQPGIGVSYINGCAGNHAGLYVTKSVGANYWIPGVTVQTNGGGGWAMGNYTNEALEFAYGTKANIDANNNVVSHIYLTADGTNTQRWICTTANGLSNNLIAVGDGTTSGIKNSGYGITTSISSSQTTHLVTSAAVATGTLLRNTLVPSGTSWSVDNLKGQTRFVYASHGTPHSGTTVAFDSSDTENYTLQLNSNYGGATGNARLSFRTRQGDQSKWSNWLYTCPVYRFNTRLEANTNQTLYVPLEMRNGTAGDCFFLVASNNYGNSGLYFLTPNTTVAHQMLITTLKASSYLTIVAINDDWGFKATAGSAAYYLTLIRLS